MSSNRVPRVFVGSSEEGLEVAQALQAALGAEYDVSVWNQGTFVMSGTGIHSLLRASQRHDFAVFVLTADDKLTTRRSTRPAARDNVLFEAGLFIGAIGLDRTFLVCSKGLRLPSDLAGVTVALFAKRDDRNLLAVLGPVAGQIRERVGELGRLVLPDERHGPEADLKRMASALSDTSRLDASLIERVVDAGGLERVLELAGGTDESVPLRNLACVLAELGHLDAAWAVARSISNNAERRTVAARALRMLAQQPNDHELESFIFRIYLSVRAPQRRELRDVATKRRIAITWPNSKS